MLNKHDINLTLSRIVKSKLVIADPNDMVLLALAFWHEGFVPDFDWTKELDEDGQHIVGYLTEFFAGFNVLCHEEREQLLRFVNKLKPLTPKNIAPDEYRDELATEWGLEHDITPYFEYLSHYQTRHYDHKSDYIRPSSNFVL